jgi:hypothetical protein
LIEQIERERMRVGESFVKNVAEAMAIQSVYDHINMTNRTDLEPLTMAI